METDNNTATDHVRCITVTTMTQVSGPMDSELHWELSKTATTPRKEPTGSTEATTGNAQAISHEAATTSVRVATGQTVDITVRGQDTTAVRTVTDSRAVTISVHTDLTTPATTLKEHRKATNTNSITATHSHVEDIITVREATATDREAISNVADTDSSVADITTDREATDNSTAVTTTVRTDTATAVIPPTTTRTQSTR